MNQILLQSTEYVIHFVMFSDSECLISEKCLIKREDKHERYLGYHCSLIVGGMHRDFAGMKRNILYLQTYLNMFWCYDNLKFKTLSCFPNKIKLLNEKKRVFFFFIPLKSYLEQTKEIEKVNSIHIVNLKDFILVQILLSNTFNLVLLISVIESAAHITMWVFAFAISTIFDLFNWNHFEMRLLNLRINFFYLLRTFCPHLDSFCVVSSFTTFWPNFTSGLLRVILPRPRIGMLSLITVSPVITAFHSCCLSHHVFDQVNLWPAWVGIELKPLSSDNARHVSQRHSGQRRWVSTVPSEHCQKIVVSIPTQAGQRFTWSKTWCDWQQLWKAVITGDTVIRLSIPIRGRG